MERADRFNSFLFFGLSAVLLTLIGVGIFVPKGVDVLWINGNHTDFSDRFFTFITRGGDGFIFLPLIFLLLFVKFSYSLAALSAWAGHGLICSVLKRVAFPEMLRPAGIIDNDLLYFVPGVDVHHNFSFPSGHTATAFCFAVLLSLVFRKKLLFMVSMAAALLIGYSRVYLLQHFLVDVAAGAFIGMATAMAAWYLFERYGKAEWMGRRLEIHVKRGSTTTRVSAP